MFVAHSALLAGPRLKIPWAQTHMYNTIMSVAAGVGLVLTVALGYELYRRKEILAQGWAAAFGALGAVLTITGAHMTLTWPLSNIHPYDNIIFGEPSLAFGIIFLGMAVVLWAEKATLASLQAQGPGSLMRLRRADCADPPPGAHPRRETRSRPELLRRCVIILALPGRSWR